LLQHLKKKGFDNIYSNTIYAMMLLIDPSSRGVHFLFGSVFIKKNNQTDLFFKKKPKPVQTDRFRFGFLEQKPVWLGFFGLAQFWLGFFPVWLGVFGLARFFSVRVRFDSVFSVPGLKNWNRTGWLFQNFNQFNRFFFTVRFFRLFFFF